MKNLVGKIICECDFNNRTAKIVFSEWYLELNIPTEKPYMLLLSVEVKPDVPVLWTELKNHLVFIDNKGDVLSDEYVMGVVTEQYEDGLPYKIVIYYDPVKFIQSSIHSIKYDDSLLLRI